MSRIITILLAGVMLFSVSGIAEAHHKPYPPDVKQARQWLKTKMPHKAFRCLHTLWHRESHWRVKAKNPYSGAYGIPQALPGRKMRSQGSDWRWNAMTQVKWGRKYIKARYGTMCKALDHQNRYGWY